MTTINVPLTEEQIRALIALGDYQWITSDYCDARDALVQALASHPTPLRTDVAKLLYATPKPSKQDWMNHAVQQLNAAE